jgi:hypothetical protein
MILKFFKQTLPSVFILITVVAMLLWLKSTITSAHFESYFDSVKMPFYLGIANIIGNSIILSKVFGFIMLLFSAFSLLQFNSKHIIIKYRTYLPSLFYILLSSSFVPLQRLNPAVFASFFLIIAINQIFSVYDNSKPLDNIFKAGLFVGIAALFYLPAIFYFVLLLIAILIIKSIDFRDLTAALFGFLTPWFFYFSYHYLVNDNALAIFQIFEVTWNVRPAEKELGMLFIVFYSFCGLIFVISSTFLLRSLPTQKISIRKFHTIFLWFILISGAITFFVPFCSVEMLYIASFPVSFIISNYFTFSKNKFWTESFFISLLVLSLLMQFV